MTRVRLARGHKYNAQKTERDGYTFDSKAEADHYLRLKLRQAAGEIGNLRLQPEFELLPAFTDSSGKRQRAINYRADFMYDEGDSVVVCDVKGVETEAFKIKRKLFLNRYPQYKFRVVKGGKGR